MTCEHCRYHTYIDGTHFCDSKNHKRRIVRISTEDAEKDIDCLWADKAESEPQESDIEKFKPCINYEDGCEEWAGCPCVHFKARK